MEKRFNQLLEKIVSYDSGADIKCIKRAWKFAKLAHYGQKRLSGEAFINHPLEVAIILSTWEMDSTTIIAGLLHDTIEDGGATREDIVNGFGDSVAVLVDGVTKVTNLRLAGSREEYFVENLRKTLLVMAKDLRVVFLKLADRLHNMRTLYALPVEKQKANAIETLEIYAPLAERLDMGLVKGELEDLAFRYAYPDEYKKLVDKSEIVYREAEERIDAMKKTLLTKMAKKGIHAKIQGRKKHLYSLWKKLERPGINWDFNGVYDIIALRILVKNIGDCYSTLGIVHSVYKPDPHEGISDFIAQPKPNGYRSIHTRIFSPGGHVVEIQIRTEEMHEEAEMGIAAHWVYSEAKSKGVSDERLEGGRISVSRDKLSWVKELVNWQQEIKDSKEYLAAVKFDALSHRNFVFTPRGDIYDLPEGATPVDFAYAVHTKLGKYIKAAKVNGKIAPLDQKLNSGDVVEIIKSKNPTVPSKRWLDFAVTTIARREIRKEGVN